ncbi:MAG: hypothetical protein II008_06355 [Oscillospiraceae bacterium]|nr:hypothetical protein [Oscillospiraceae bacterium]
MNDTDRKMHETICIECKYQCSRKCSWAWEFVPVDGWNAIETKNGYDVYECPNFQKGRGLPRAGFDTDGVIHCLQALMIQTRDDYIKGVDLNIDNDGNKKKSKYRKPLTPEERAQTRAACRKRIEHWLRNDGQKLMMLSDPEAVINQLRKFARKYEAEMASVRSRANSWR